jgi:hypothetical protein
MIIKPKEAYHTATVSIRKGTDTQQPAQVAASDRTTPSCGLLRESKIESERRLPIGRKDWINPDWRDYEPDDPVSDILEGLEALGRGY